MAADQVAQRSKVDDLCASAVDGEGATDVDGVGEQTRCVVDEDRIGADAVRSAEGDRPSVGDVVDEPLDELVRILPGAVEEEGPDDHDRSKQWEERAQCDLGAQLGAEIEGVLGVGRGKGVLGERQSGAGPVDAAGRRVDNLCDAGARRPLPDPDVGSHVHLERLRRRRREVPEIALLRERDDGVDPRQSTAVEGGTEVDFVDGDARGECLHGLRRSGVRPDGDGDLVAAGDELVHQRTPQESGGPGDENAHRSNLRHSQSRQALLRTAARNSDDAVNTP